VGISGNRDCHGASPLAKTLTGYEIATPFGLAMTRTFGIPRCAASLSPSPSTGEGEGEGEPPYADTALHVARPLTLILVYSHG